MTVDHTIAPEPGQKRRIRRVIAGSLVGTTMEYFDFFSYTVAAVLVFPQLMFPAYSPATGTLLAFASIGVAFVARPFGALLFGHIGDRYGRQRVLVASLAMMGGATVLIGLLPGYDQWRFAPILLVALRLVQGLAVAGENTGSSVLAMEHAPVHRRGLMSGFTGTGSALGILLANGTFFVLSSTLTDEQFLDWGWRVPFLASVVLLAFGLWVRSTIPETPVYTVSASAPRRVPLWDLLRNSRRVILLAIGAMLFGNVLYYTVQTFMLSYGTRIGIPRDTMLAATTVAVAVQAVMNLVWAGASDRFGRRRVVVLGALLGAAWMFPLMLLVQSQHALLVIIGFVVSMTLFAMHGAPQAAYLSGMFDTRVRLTGLAFAANAGGLLGGALAPIVADRVLVATGSIWWVAVVVLGVALLSCACMAFLPEIRPGSLAEPVRHDVRPTASGSTSVGSDV